MAHDLDLPPPMRGSRLPSERWDACPHAGDGRGFKAAQPHGRTCRLASGPVLGVAMHEENVVALHAELGTEHLLRLAAYQRLGSALLLPAVPELRFRIAVATALMMRGA